MRWKQRPGRTILCTSTPSSGSWPLAYSKIQSISFWNTLWCCGFSEELKIKLGLDARKGRGFCSTLGRYNHNTFYGHLLAYWYPYLPCWHLVKIWYVICNLYCILWWQVLSMSASVRKLLIAYIDNCTLSTGSFFVSFGISFIIGDVAGHILFV
jgi:hypothetical protein